MSNLSATTSKKALKVLAKTLRYFRELQVLGLTAADDFDARAAENLIRGILETNHYKPHQGKTNK